MVFQPTRGSFAVPRIDTHTMLCAYLSHSRACVGVGPAYHMTTAHASRPLLTLACISVYIACTSPRIGRQPAIPASGSEGLGSYLHRSDPGDHGRHVRHRALPSDHTGVEVDLRPTWSRTGRADRPHQQRSYCVSAPHMSYSRHHRRMSGCMCVCITQCIAK